jgi:phosphoglycolate phosphatase-like HAD superfamily hydrolase
MTTAFIFDVEGTLVDSVGHQLRCLRETLRLHGRAIPISTLQEFSGMDGNDMLEKLTPDLDEEGRKAILKDQGRRFEKHYLPSIKPIPGVRKTLSALKAMGCRIGLATDCDGPPLRRYRKILKIDDLLDAIACGEDAREGKPSPKLIEFAILKLRSSARTSIMIGDTPFDAQAATACGVTAIGVLTGGFEDQALRAAGCTVVFPSLRHLQQWAVQLADATAIGASDRKRARAAVRRGNSAANHALPVSSKKGITMAVNKPVGDNARKGAVRKRSQLKTKVAGEAHWTKRSKSSGRFMDQKKSASAKPYKGVRKEKAR